MASVPDPITLATLPLFQGLTQEELTRLRPLLHAARFPAGTSIITTEQPGELLYIILSGTVKIHVAQLDGAEVIIAFGGPGDVEGEMSLLEAEVSSADVTTQEATIALWLGRTSFQTLRASVPQLSDNLARILAARLRMANARIQALCTLDVNGRVARQLLAFAQYYHQTSPTGALLVPLRLTQSDLASLVGASRERVNKALSFYRARDLLTRDDRGTFAIPDPEALERFCR